MGAGKAIWLLAAAGAALPAWAQTTVTPAEGAVTFKCPGNVYTNMITPQEARARNCTTIDGAPVTVMHSAKPRQRPGDAPPASAAASGTPAPARSSAPEARVERDAQRQRDSDARRILESELKREEEKLAALNKEFNNGNPERRGEEQNYARYQERVAEMKAGIGRKEADIAAIKRELAKLPQ